MPKAYPATKQNYKKWREQVRATGDGRVGPSLFNPVKPGMTDDELHEAWKNETYRANSMDALLRAKAAAAQRRRDKYRRPTVKKKAKKSQAA